MDFMTFKQCKVRRCKFTIYTMKVLVEVANGMTERTSVTESNLETGIFTPNDK